MRVVDLPGHGPAALAQHRPCLLGQLPGVFHRPSRHGRDAGDRHREADRVGVLDAVGEGRRDSRRRSVRCRERPPAIAEYAGFHGERPRDAVGLAGAQGEQQLARLEVVAPDRIGQDQSLGGGPADVDPRELRRRDLRGVALAKADSAERERGAVRKSIERSAPRGVSGHPHADPLEHGLQGRSPSSMCPLIRNCSAARRRSSSASASAAPGTASRYACAASAPCPALERASPSFTDRARRGGRVALRAQLEREPVETGGPVEGERLGGARCGDRRRTPRRVRGRPPPGSGARGPRGRSFRSPRAPAPDADDAPGASRPRAPPRRSRGSGRGTARSRRGPPRRGSGRGAARRSGERVLVLVLEARGLAGDAAPAAAVRRRQGSRGAAGPSRAAGGCASGMTSSSVVPGRAAGRRKGRTRRSPLGGLDAGLA